MRLRVLWPVAASAIAFVVVSVVLWAGASGSWLASAGFWLWAVLPYLLTAGLVLLVASRSRPGWWVASVLAVAVAMFGLAFCFGDDDDAQAGLIWLFVPLYQLAAVLVGGLAVLVVVKVAGRRRQAPV